MKRRHLLKYGTFAAWGYGLTACNRLPDTVRLPGRSAKQANLESTPPILDLSAPEKQTLTLGYVPDLAIAPWLMALTQGFFEQYGLEVELYPQVDQQAVEQGLLESRFDAAITSFSTPLIYQLKSPRVDLVALMQIHRHGGVFCGCQQTWADNIRSGIDYANFAEFAAAYRDYVRALPEKTFGVDHDYSTTAYLYRYWWAALGFHPDRDLELVTFAPTELRHKLQAGLIQGYCSQEPWGQEAIATDSGFIQYLSGDIWQGHPGPVITTSAGWREENPNTAKALIAATLQGCQYCQDPTNAATIGPLLASNLDLDPAALTALFSGQYFYGETAIALLPGGIVPFGLTKGDGLRPPTRLIIAGNPMACGSSPRWFAGNILSFDNIPKMPANWWRQPIPRNPTGRSPRDLGYVYRLSLLSQRFTSLTNGLFYRTKWPVILTSLKSAPDPISRYKNG